MKFEFKKASKKKSKLRCMLYGPSGSGKTYTALQIASGLGEKIAVIDTERGSASLYAGKVEFDVLELPNFEVDTYVSAIQSAVKAGYDVIVIDSTTHAWDKIKEDVDKVANKSTSKNTWSAWGSSVGTPAYKKLVESIVTCPAHIIATSRAKTDWIQEEYRDRDGNKKTKPRRVGMALEQKGGVEYEFTLVGELNTDHVLTVIKDRTEKYQDKEIEKPGRELGIELIEWLNTGDEIPEPAPILKATTEQLNQFNTLTRELKILGSQISKKLSDVGCRTLSDLPQETMQKWIDGMLDKIAKQANDKMMEEAKKHQKISEDDAESARIAKELEGEDVF